MVLIVVIRKVHVRIICFRFMPQNYIPAALRHKKYISDDIKYRSCNIIDAERNISGISSAGARNISIPIAEHAAYIYRVGREHSKCRMNQYFILTK